MRTCEVLGQPQGLYLWLDRPKYRFLMSTVGVLNSHAANLGHETSAPSRISKLRLYEDARLFLLSNDTSDGGKCLSNSRWRRRS
ncbi:hypothetical protein BDR06DRAFT_661531 [Suillus hirtellus]|nr:hypothetical protein BDR06DRAFT_661531 [Suillus hirtellus]